MPQGKLKKFSRRKIAEINKSFSQEVRKKCFPRGFLPILKKKHLPKSITPNKVKGGCCPLNSYFCSEKSDDSCPTRMGQVCKMDLGQRLIKTILLGNTDKAIDCIQAGALINIRDCGGRTPLMLAALHGNLILVQLLINIKVNAIVRCELGNTALDYAKIGANGCRGRKSDFKKIICLLLQYEANGT